MKLKEALSLMKEQGLIDDGELYSYGQKASVLGGAAGAAVNAVLICVKDDVLRIFQAHLNNSWSNNFLTAKKEELSCVKVKNVFFGMQKKLCFTYAGANYKFIVPFGSKNLVAYFKELAK